MSQILYWRFVKEAAKIIIKLKGKYLLFFKVLFQEKLQLLGKKKTKISSGDTLLYKNLKFSVYAKCL